MRYDSSVPWLAQCSDPGRLLLLLDKPPGPASVCYVLQSVFLSGLCFPDFASPALSAGLSQGLVLDPSLKLVCGSFSQPTSLDSFTPQAGPSVLSPKKPIFLWSHSPPGWFCPTVHGLSVSLPPKHPPPFCPVTGLLCVLLSPLEEEQNCPFLTFTRLLVPLHTSVHGSDFLGGCLHH